MPNSVPPSEADLPSTPTNMALTPRSRKLLLWGIVLVLVVVLAIAIPVGVTQSNKSSSSGSSASSGSGPSAAQASSSAKAGSFSATSGSDGSTVLLDSGEEVVYSNPFGGEWAFDLGSYTDGGALGGGKAQSWSKRVGEEWTWGQDVARGVSFILFFADSLLERSCRSSS